MDEKPKKIEEQKISAAGEIDKPAIISPIIKVGKITISGTLSSVREKEGVEQAVRACDGVVDIENKIQIESLHGSAQR